MHKTISSLFLGRFCIFLLRCRYFACRSKYKKFKIQFSKEMFMGTTALKPKGVDQRQQDTVFSLHIFRWPVQRRANC